MTDYNRGEVVLVGFVFTEETAVSQRPAVIISSDAYHQGRREAIIVAITSNVDRLLVGDHLIGDWQGAGLLYPSVATGIIRTIKRDMIARKLGAMPLANMVAVDNRLRISLGLT